MRAKCHYLFSVSIICFFALSFCQTNAITIALPITTQASLEPVQANLIKRVNDIIKQEIDKLRAAENSVVKELSSYPIVKPILLGYLPLYAGAALQAHDLSVLKKECELLQMLSIASGAVQLPLKQEISLSADGLSIVLVIEDTDKKLAHMHAVVKAGMQALNDLYQVHYKKIFIEETPLPPLWQDPVIQLVRLPKDEMNAIASQEQLWEIIVERMKREVFTKIKLPTTQCAFEAIVLADQEKNGTYALLERYPFGVK